MIDERGLDAACREFKEHLYIAGKTSTDERIALQAAIEAYEASKWRPIEEAKRDGEEVLVQLGWPNESQTQTVVLYLSIGHWFDCQNNAQPPDWLANAMFRTIDLPTQNDVSSGMEGASDDESNKPFISVHDELSEPGDRRMDQETPRSKS